ncbi:MAG: tetratricopeptide repeat protein, partial [Verrucomicrobia bacterium]|nr:tetratricopeptide repeat protein [Verrucomicrobiota bacterium]
MLPPSIMLTTKKWGATQRRRALPRAGGPGWVAAAALAWLALGLVGCGPRGATALLTGERLIREGRPAEAIEPLKRAVELLGTNTTACAQAWNHLGLAYHHVGDWTNAARAYQNALSRDFNLIAARYNRGCLFLEQNQLVGAINELTTYTAYDPNHTDAWLRLGTAQLRSRQLDDAERSFSQVLRLDSSPAEKAESLNGLGLGQVLRRKPREAFAYFHAALKHQTNYAPTLLNQAIVAHYQLNDRAAALPCYQAYLAAQPQAASNAILLATIRKLEDELRPPPPPPPPP